MNKQDSRPICPKCNIPMGKQSKRFTSPGRQVQRWSCSKCGAIEQTEITKGEGK